MYWYMVLVRNSTKDWLIDLYYLFNDGYILQLRSETVAVRRRMNMISEDYDGQMIPGNECDTNFLTFVLQLSKNLGKPQLGNRRGHLVARPAIASNGVPFLKMKYVGSRHLTH